MSASLRPRRYCVVRDPMPAHRAHDRAVQPLIALVFVFWTLKSILPSVAGSEERLMLDAALRMAEGFLPYVDFGFPHPPLSVAPGMLIIACLRELNHLAMTMSIPFFNIFTDLAALHVLTSIVPLFAATMTGVMVYALVQYRCGTIPAVFSAALYYFSCDVLWASSCWTGCNWATMWLFMGAAAVALNRPKMAGLFLGAAICTETYVVVPSVSIVVFLALQRRHDAVRCAALALGSCLGILAVCFLTTGADRLWNTESLSFVAVASSTPVGLSTSNILFSLRANFFLMAAPVFILPVLLHAVLTDRRYCGIVSLRTVVDLQKRPALAMLILVFSVWLVHLFFVLALHSSSRAHLQPLLPFSAFCGGVFVRLVLSSVPSLANSRRWWSQSLRILRDCSLRVRTDLLVAVRSSSTGRGTRPATWLPDAPSANRGERPTGLETI